MPNQCCCQGSAVLLTPPDKTMDALPATEITALLGRGTRFEGKLYFEGRVRVDGIFKGEIKSEHRTLKTTLREGPPEAATTSRARLDALVAELKNAGRRRK